MSGGIGRGGQINGGGENWGIVEREEASSQHGRDWGESPKRGIAHDDEVYLDDTTSGLSRGILS
jgi:hypothetical protein